MQKLWKPDFEIIDFHTHPFVKNSYNISAYRNEYVRSGEDVLRDLSDFGIERFAGSFIDLENRAREGERFPFETVRRTNDEALAFRDANPERYIAGFHIHPDYVEESVNEVERMAKAGVRLIGELVPYLHGWRNYNAEGIFPILDAAAKHGMVVSFHNMSNETIEDMVSSHPDIIFVAAHPGERMEVDRNVALMKKYDNLCLDLSGTGIFRWPMLRFLVDSVGYERILFGSDYPTCSPGVYIGGVLAEQISDVAREHIFSLNAKRILNLK